MVVSSTKSTSTKINNLFARPGLGAGAFFYAHAFNPLGLCHNLGMCHNFFPQTYLSRRDLLAWFRRHGIRTDGWRAK